MIATRCEMSDWELVAAVRAGEDSAFEELFRRYQPRVAAYVRRMVRDEARAEDLAQDAFFSALRRLRATDTQIIFKPWIFEIARNAAIDHWRRTSRTEEVSVDEEERLRPADRVRLVGSAAPDAAMIDKERLAHLQGAFDELSDVHTRVLVMRELEGMSYREIADRLDLSRASVESALFRARRRLESEYADISEGRRCESMRAVMGRLAEGLSNGRDEGRLARHARRCHTCRRRARELGVEPLAPSRLRDKVAALLPLPLFLRRGDGGLLSGLLGGPAGAQAGPALAERAAALAAAVAIGAGGAALGGAALIDGTDRERAKPPPTQRPDATAPRPERARESGSATPNRTAPARRPGDSPARPRKAQPGGRAERGTGPGGGPDASAGPSRGADPAQPPAAPTGGGLPDLPATPKMPSAPSGPSGSAPSLPAVPDLPLPELPAPPVAPPPVSVPPIQTPERLPLDTGPVTDTVTDTLDEVLPK